jgi:hypothetical protein
MGRWGRPYDFAENGGRDKTAYPAISTIHPPFYIEQRHHPSDGQHIQASHQTQPCLKLIYRLPDNYKFHKLFNKQNEYQVVSVGPFCSIGAIRGTITTIQINFLRIPLLIGRPKSGSTLPKSSKRFPKKREKILPRKGTGVPLFLEFT